MVSAAQEFRALPLEVKIRVAKILETLVNEPRPRGVRKLQGRERLYRMRVWHYRVIYEIDDRQNVIKVTQVRHRRDAYR